MVAVQRSAHAHTHTHTHTHTLKMLVSLKGLFRSVSTEKYSYPFVCNVQTVSEYATFVTVAFHRKFVADEL